MLSGFFTLPTILIHAETDGLNPGGLLVFHGGLAKSWPDGIDAVITAVYLAIAFGIPLLGYVLMALNIRAYLRSLGRAVVVVARSVPTIPYWVQSDRPTCLEALGLQLPITESDVLAAYRQRVKQLHPDRGGDLQKFLKLQRHFEQAQNLARQHARRQHANVPFS
jgi:hypothetical protein